MENEERRRGGDRRRHFKTKDNPNKSYEILAYELDCINDEIQELGNEIRDINRKMTKG